MFPVLKSPSDILHIGKHLHAVTPDEIRALTAQTRRDGMPDQVHSCPI